MFIKHYVLCHAVALLKPHVLVHQEYLDSAFAM